MCSLVEGNARGANGAPPIHLLRGQAEFLSPEGGEVQFEVEWRPLVGAGSVGGLLRLRLSNPELSKLSHDSQASRPSGLSCSSCCLFANAPYAVARHRLLYDANDRPCDYLFLEVNPAFEKLTGWESSKVIGKTVRELMGDAAAPWIERYGEVVVSGRHATFEDFAQGLNRWYYVVAYPMGGDEFVVAFEDITERVQLTHERELLTKTLGARPRCHTHGHYRVRTSEGSVCPSVGQSERRDSFWLYP
ncbi:MAG: hypothetical protein KatS3mg130_1532 [Candidatus Sumerlaea sp.]|nr:MAG: hypothetical protein KatS3mg130_1532 [Candidatus Sumerlaea sp.]